MKILRIALRNLASLSETHTVDFTREPLRSAGLFSISGPTGSGKSTLLDALCLALYEKTPRLASASGEQIPDGATATTLTPRDPGNLLRRGAAEGFAEVAFVGVDGLVYTARWTIRRARNRPDGNLQNSEMILLSGNVAHPISDPVAVGGKKSEVLPAIAEKVGLTFPQFTRAVLLAQNDFAVFLKSNDQERASILEALTGTGRFAAISRLVFERHKAEREAVTALENQLAGAVPLTPEARTTAEAEHQAAATATAQAESALAGVLQQLRWFEQDHALAAAATQADTAVTSARGAVDAAAPRAVDLGLTEKVIHSLRPLHDAEQVAIKQLTSCRTDSEEATRRDTAASAALAKCREVHATAATAAEHAGRALADAQPALQNARLLDAQIEALAPRLSQAVTARGTTESARLREDQALQSLRAQIAAHDTTLAALAARQAALAAYAGFVDDLAAWRDRLATAETGRATLALRTREAVDCSGRVTLLRAEREKARAAVDQHQQTLAQADGAHIAAERAARAFDPDALAARRALLDREQAALNALQSHLARVANIDTRHQSETAALARLGTEHTAQHQALDEITRTKLPAALAALTAAQAALKLLEAADDNSVPRLRAALLPDQPCPVCGSLHHPGAASAHGVEPAALRALRDQVADHQRHYDVQRTEQTRLKTALELAEKDRVTRQAAVDRLAGELAAARQQRPDSDTLVAILALSEGEQAVALTAALATSAMARAAHDKLEAEQRLASSALAAAIAKRDLARGAHTQAAGTLAARQTALAAAEASCTAARAQRDIAETEHAAHLAALGPIFDRLSSARTAFEQDAKAFATAFVADVESLSRLRRQIDEVTTLRGQEQARLPGREEAQAAATQTFTTAAKEEANLLAEQARLQKERRVLFAGRPVATVLAELEAAVATTKAAHEARARELAEAEKSAAAASESARSRQAAVEAASVALAAAEAALDHALVAFVTPAGLPFDRAALAVYLARDSVWLDTERKALAALRDALQAATGQHQAHAAALATHRAQSPTKDSEDTVRALRSTRDAELTVAKERLVTAAAAITADDQRRTVASALIEEMETRRNKAAPWGRLDELIGSSDGAKFRAIVQRHALDILLGHANAQLDLISARYRLERLPDSLNLIVCDRDMADERRSVHSLSGGESFLVSLALALGLASLTSNRLRVESLFIDEGFGSLDPTTLETAMSALMRLESQGRKVGVISHVTEMTDAIPVQIRVVKGRGGASWIEVPGAELVSESTAIGGGADGLRPGVVSSDPVDAVDVETLAAMLLALLQAAETAGEGPVSTRSLRAKLGCDLRSFDAARVRLGARVLTTGRSLGLAPIPAS